MSSSCLSALRMPKHTFTQVASVGTWRAVPAVHEFHQGRTTNHDSVTGTRQFVAVRCPVCRPVLQQCVRATLRRCCKVSECLPPSVKGEMPCTSNSGDILNTISTSIEPGCMARRPWPQHRRVGSTVPVRAKPSARLPERTVDIFCSACKFRLYKACGPHTLMLCTLCMGSRLALKMPTKQGDEHKGQLGTR
jgi:hypothetical protein